MDTARQTPGPRSGSSDDLLKLLALSLTLADHVGWLLLPGAEWLRWAGRPAMPLLAYLLAAGFRRTRSRKAYALRLLAVAAASQAVLLWAAPATGRTLLNPLFVLLLGLGWLAWRERQPFAAWAVLAGLVAAAPLAGTDPLGFVSYGSYGVACVAVLDAFLLRRREPLLASLALLVLSVAWWLPGLYPGYQCLAAAVPLGIVAAGRFRGPMLPVAGRRWLYAFYPAHLLLLGLAARFAGLPLR